MGTKFVILPMGSSNQFQNLETWNLDQNLSFDLIWSDLFSTKARVLQYFPELP